MRVGIPPAGQIRLQGSPLRLQISPSEFLSRLHAVLPDGDLLLEDPSPLRSAHGHLSLGLTTEAAEILLDAAPLGLLAIHRRPDALFLRERGGLDGRLRPIALAAFG